MIFEFEETPLRNAKMKVVGVGGAGGNAVNRMIDENLDGIYGSGIAYGSNWGLGPESYQPDLDCVVIGKSTPALPPKSRVRTRL